MKWYIPNLHLQDQVNSNENERNKCRKRFSVLDIFLKPISFLIKLIFLRSTIPTNESMNSTRWITVFWLGCRGGQWWVAEKKKPRTEGRGSIYKTRNKTTGSNDGSHAGASAARSTLTFMFNFEIIDSIIEKCLFNAPKQPKQNESENAARKRSQAAVMSACFHFVFVVLWEEREECCVEFRDGIRSITWDESYCYGIDAR